MPVNRFGVAFGFYWLPGAVFGFSFGLRAHKEIRLMRVPAINRILFFSCLSFGSLFGFADVSAWSRHDEVHSR